MKHPTPQAIILAVAGIAQGILVGAKAGGQITAPWIIVILPAAFPLLTVAIAASWVYAAEAHFRSSFVIEPPRIMEADDIHPGAWTEVPAGQKPTKKYVMSVRYRP